MSGEVRVREVENAADDRAFRELPYRLYADDPLWVPPLRIAEAARWRTRSNPSLRRRWHRRFLAWRDGRAVGRVAAILDPPFAWRWSPATGLVGFFECERAPEVSRALLGRAEEALRAQRATTVMGPVNLTTHDEVGLLVAGGSDAPSVLTPYNPPFYADLLADAGYERSRDYLAYDWTPRAEESRTLRRLARGGGAVTVRAIDPSRWDDEVRLLHRLYNAAFDRLWGFVPIGLDEFRDRADQFRPFYRPDLVLVAERHGEPVGFAVLLPDVHQALPVAKGRLLPFGWWRLKRALPRIRRGRFVLLGVRPEHAGRGVAAHLALAMGRAVRAAGYEAVDVSLVLEGNARMQRVIEAFGCVRARTYRLFRKELGA